MSLSLSSIPQHHSVIRHLPQSW